MAVNETIERIIYEGVDKISSEAKKAADSNRTLRVTIDEVKSALAVFGVTVGAGAMVALYKDTLNAIAALDDMAEATGASVEKLSAIQRIAKIGGLEFEGLTGQVGKMIKGLRDGTDEGGRMAHAFEVAGIKTRDANGRFRDTGQILFDVADHLKKFRDDGEKVAFVQDALGKGAERYLPLLKDMGEATERQGKVTAEQAARAEEAEKNMRRLTLAMEDQRKELVNEYTPALIRMTDHLLSMQKVPGNFWANLFSVSGSQANDPLAAITQIEGRLARLRADRDVLAGPGIGASFNRMMAPEDLTVLNRQIAYAERQLAVLRELHVRGVGRNAQGMAEDAAGNVGPEPAKPSMGYQSIDPAEIKRRHQELVEAAIRARNDGAFDKAQKELNPFYLSPEEQEKAGAAWVRSIVEMKQDTDAKISRFQLNPTMDDDALNPEKDARLVAFMESLKTQEQLENEAHQRRMAQFDEFTTEELTAFGGRQALIEGMNSEHQERLLSIERNKHQAQRSMEMSTLSLAAGLLQQFAGKSKAAALAAIAISKGLHIAQTIQATGAAVMRAYADLGPVAGSAAAAWIKTLGAIQIGLISASGLLEAGSAGGGGGAQGTFPASPNSGLPQTSPAVPSTQEQPASMVTIINVPRGRRTFTLEEVDDWFELMNEAARKGGRLDKVIIRES